MKFILGLFLVAAALIAGIVLMVRRTPIEDTPKPVSQRVKVNEYGATSATAIYTVEGELNAEEDHRAIRISVNRNRRTLEVLTGYSQTVVQSQTFSNTQPAYEEFVHALENAGFSRSQEAKYSSENGVCPLGRRYMYELNEDDKEVVRSWSTSCGRTDGSFAGNAGLIRQLFENQIPEYKTFVKDVRL
jgi:hypothetical protein